MTLRPRWPAFAAAALIGMPTSGPLLAQTPAREMPEVRVTGTALDDELTEDSGSYTVRSTSAATGLKLTPRETPQAVTVITRQRMDDQGLSSLGSVIDQVTGLSTFGRGGASNASYAWTTSRGYTVSNMLLDGILVPISLFSSGSHEDWSSVDTAVYDSVTVVRGPNGLLTGSGEPSGTIALTRKRPTDHLHGSGSISIGRWNQRRAVADVGGPLTDNGQLRGRLVLSHGDGKSWLARYRGTDSTLYGIIETDLGAATRASVSLEHGRTTGLGAGPYSGMDTAFDDGTPTPFTRGVNAYTRYSQNRVRRTSVSVALEHRFSDALVGRLQYLSGRQSSNRSFVNVSAPPARDGTVPLYFRRLASEGQPDAFAASVEGQYSLWGRRQLFTVGVNGYHDRRRDRPGNGDLFTDEITTDAFAWTGVYPEPDWNQLEPFSHSKSRTDQVGLFFNNRLQVTDTVAVLTGGRLSNWHYRETDLDTGEQTDNRKENGVFTPYLGLTWDFTRHLTAFASYTTIFEPQNLRDQAGRLLDPEEGRSLEVGIKGAWFDNRLNAGLTVFEIRKDKLGVLDGGRTPTGDDSYVATDGTKGRGWEVEIAGALHPGWSIQAGYGRAVIRAPDGVRLNTEAPKEMFKLFTTWTPASIQALTVGGGVYWQSKAYAGSATPEFLEAYTIKPYTVVNLMGRYQINPNLSATLNLYNLFDRTYRVDETGHDYGSPRTLMATLRYQL